MLLIQYWHVTRLVLSILHFSMLLQVITSELCFQKLDPIYHKEEHATCRRLWFYCAVSGVGNLWICWMMRGELWQGFQLSNATLHSLSSKGSFKDCILNCQLKLCKLFCLQSWFSLFTLIADYHCVYVGGPGHQYGVDMSCLIGSPLGEAGQWNFSMTVSLSGVLSYHTRTVWLSWFVHSPSVCKTARTKRFNLTNKTTNPWEVN